MLRISGESLDADVMVAECGLIPLRVWRKNEARTLKGRVHADSGANFVVSEAGFEDFACQVKEAVEFLEGHSKLVAKMAAFPGVHEAVLDFG